MIRQLQVIILSLFLFAITGLSAVTYAQCSITIQDLATSFGNPTTNNTYSLFGNLVLSDPPATGQIAVRVQGGPSRFYDAPFDGTIPFMVEGLYADGATRVIEVEFSDEPTCNASTTYTAPDTDIGDPKLPLGYRAPELNYNQLNGETFDLFIPGMTDESETTPSVFSLNIADQSVSEYAAFCMELEEPIFLDTNYTDQFVVIPLEDGLRGTAGTGASQNIPAEGLGRIKAGQIRWLFDNYYQGTSFNDHTTTEAAAFQLVVWEISHDHFDGSPLTVESGIPGDNFYAADPGAARAAAQAILDEINTLAWTDQQWESYISEAWHPIFLESAEQTTVDSENVQDLILAVPFELDVSDENLTLLLTNGPCWRFLSSPFQTRRDFVTGSSGQPVPVPDTEEMFTYNHLIGQWWTQGVIGSDYAAASEANIFLWPLGEGGNSSAQWSTDFGGNGLDGQAEAGRGFLMSVFSADSPEPDDSFDDTWPAGDKEAVYQYIPEDVWGFDPDTPTDIPAPLNSTTDGWSLVGNPFDESIVFSQLPANNITGVAYIYDRNYAGPGAGDDIGDNIGGWRTTDGNYGDITDGEIAPFQGFFVQNDGASPGLTFAQSARTSTNAEFYGKENENRDFVRLELSGEGLYNSAWVTFSDGASFERMRGDAFELQPFTQDFALFGTRKGDDLFDIGRFPLGDDVQVPVSVETTLPGSYSISATDFDLPAGYNLVFVDRQENVSIPMDENFAYQFTISQAAHQKGFGMEALSCGATQQQIAEFFRPQKAKTAGGDRFAIVVNPSASQVDSELPSSVELKQNYPNPFNPSTVISYQLPQASEVMLTVYDLTGRQVATLVDGTMQTAGSHNVTFDAGNLSSGVYIYRLQAGSRILTKKLTLIK